MNKSIPLLIEQDNIKWSTRFDQTDTLSLPERHALHALLNTSYPDWGFDKIFERLKRRLKEDGGIIF